VVARTGRADDAGSADGRESDGDRQGLSRLPPSADLATDRDQALHGMHELLRKAQRTGALRTDIVLEDLILVLMANDGIRAEPPNCGRRPLAWT